MKANKTIIPKIDQFFAIISNTGNQLYEKDNEKFVKIGEKVGNQKEVYIRGDIVYVKK